MDLNDGEASRPKGALCRSLSACISAVFKFVGAGEVPFANVEELIKELINRLVSEASSDANHMSYCGDELSKILAERSSASLSWRRGRSLDGQTIQKTTEISQQQYIDKVVDVRFAVVQLVVKSRRNSGTQCRPASC